MSLLHKQLDDDLVMEILRRVPVEQLWWRCRRVCKKWHALILSPHVAHLPHASPSTFLVSFNNKETGKLDFFYPGKDDAEAFNGSLVQHWKHQMVTGKDVVPVASCKGLVLFNPFLSSDFYIGNPITGELITVKHPIGLWGRVEFFYHSSMKEYKLLRCHPKGYANNHFEYALLTLGSKKWRRLGAFPNRVRYGSMPIKPAEDASVRDGRPANMLVFVGRRGPSMGYLVPQEEDNCRVQVVGIQDSELLLFWCGIGMFRYSLLRNAVEKIELEGMDEPEPPTKGN
ncbi:hypothetical protein V6N13_147690 [Hibiscus sabdariffa]